MIINKKLIILVLFCSFIKHNIVNATIGMERGFPATKGINWNFEFKNKSKRPVYITVKNLINKNTGQNLILLDTKVDGAKSSKEKDQGYVRLSGLDLDQRLEIGVSFEPGQKYAYRGYVAKGADIKRALVSWENGWLRPQKGSGNKTQSGINLKGNVTALAKFEFKLPINQKPIINKIQAQVEPPKIEVVDIVQADENNGEAQEHEDETIEKKSMEKSDIEDLARILAKRRGELGHEEEEEGSRPVRITEPKPESTSSKPVVTRTRPETKKEKQIREMREKKAAEAAQRYKEAQEHAKSLAGKRSPLEAMRAEELPTSDDDEWED